MIVCPLEHFPWWQRCPLCSLSLIARRSSPWGIALEESYWGTHVLLVDFVVWPFLCRWCCCSYIKCNGQQNVLITALRGCQNKTSDDLAHWLLTLFVAYQHQSLPFCLLSCLCESLSIKSRYAAHFFPDVPYFLLICMSSFLSPSYVSPCSWSRGNVLSVQCRHYLIRHLYLHLYHASYCHMRPPLLHSWPSDGDIFVCFSSGFVLWEWRDDCAQILQLCARFFSCVILRDRDTAHAAHQILLLCARFFSCIILRDTFTANKSHFVLCANL